MDSGRSIAKGPKTSLFLPTLLFSVVKTLQKCRKIAHTGIPGGKEFP